MTHENHDSPRETRLLRIRATKIVVVAFLVISLAGCEDLMGLVGLGEDDEGEASGTVTIEATGTERFDGEIMRARLVNDGDDVDSGTALAQGSTEIDSSGTTSITLANAAGDATWEGEGGTNYDLRIYVDTDDSGDYEVYDHYAQDSTSVTIDGDQTVQASEFVVNRPSGSSYYVSMSGSSSYGGQSLVIRVFEDDADPDTDSPVGVKTETVPSSGSVVATIEHLYTDSIVWKRVVGSTYDAYIHIETDGDKQAESGESVYSSFPHDVLASSSSLSVDQDDFSTYTP